MNTSSKSAWDTYKGNELSALTPILTELGFELFPEQPHVGGERFLMQAVTTTSGKKVILEGVRRNDNLRVIIKATRDPFGIHELEHERLCRKVLGSIRFAYDVFSTPEEVAFVKKEGFLIAITAYIPKDAPFVSRPTKEQFAFALRALKAQEGAHAATFEQERLVRKTFGLREYADYLESFKRFAEGSSSQELFSSAQAYLEHHEQEITQYGGFLTHTDFVPHNFRIHDGVMYLLDHSSLRFGNKYEGWARFLNFMALYNPELEEALVTYVQNNRTPEERAALTAMRIYRLGELIAYYHATLAHSEGDLLTLNTIRVALWTTGLSNLVKDPTRTRIFSQEEVTQYQSRRDALRSNDEEKRQKNLH